MSPNTENPNLPEQFNARLEALAQSTAITLKVHSDMIISIDTKLDRISASVETIATRQSENDARIERLT